MKHELRALRLLERDDSLAAVERAKETLGDWLCPSLSPEARGVEVQRFLSARRGARAAFRAGVIVEAPQSSQLVLTGHIKHHGSDTVSVHVHSVGLDGSTKPLGKVDATPNGEFSVHVGRETQRLSTIQLEFCCNGISIGRTAPTHAEREIWITWAEAEDAPDGRPGKFEVQSEYLANVVGAWSALARTEEGGSSPAPVVDLAALNPAVLSAASGMLRADVDLIHRSALLAKRTGLSPAEASVLVSVCAESSSVGEDWLREAERELLETRPETVVARLQAHGKSGMVCERLVSRVDAVRQAHLCLRRDTWLNERSGSDHTWAEVLAAAGVSGTSLDVEQFVGDFSTFWERVCEGHVEQHPTIEWAPLTGFHAGTIAELRANGVQRVQEELLNRSPREIGTAASSGAQASSLVQALEERFPGHALVWAAKEAGMQGASDLFAHKQIDLNRVPVILLREASESDARTDSAVPDSAGPLVDAAAKEQLMKLQRLLRVAQTKVGVDALLQLGFGSAQDIATLSLSEFETRATGAFAPDEAARIWTRARARYRAAANVYVAQANSRNFSTSPANSAVALAPEHAALVARVPSLRDLFGSQDYCACEDCQSVLGLPAYLVDLLLWSSDVRITNGSTEQSLLKLLNDRRPDLTQTLLDCKNADILLPNIDIVCELLEDRIASTHMGLPRSSVRQTSKNAQEIRAFPEHVRSDVYLELARVRDDLPYWPFNLEAAEVRAYLEAVIAQEASLGPLLGVYQHFAPDGLNSDVYVREILGLDSSQWQVVTTPRPEIQDRVWDCQSGLVTVENILRRGAALLSRPMAYSEMEALLETDFVVGDPADKLAIQLIATNDDDKPFDNCKADARRIVRQTPAGEKPVDQDTLDRACRLLLLSASTGASVSQLDASLSVARLTANDGDLTAAQLRLVGTMLDAANRLQKDLAYIAFMLGGPDHSGIEAKALQAAKKLIQAGHGLFDDGAASLAASLGVPQDELRFLATNYSAWGGALTNRSVSALCRHLHVARAVELPMGRYWAVGEGGTQAVPAAGSLRQLVLRSQRLKRLGLELQSSLDFLAGERIDLAAHTPQLLAPMKEVGLLWNRVDPSGITSLEPMLDVFVRWLSADRYTQTFVLREHKTKFETICEALRDAKKGGQKWDPTIATTVPDLKCEDELRILVRWKLLLDLQAQLGDKFLGVALNPISVSLAEGANVSWLDLDAYLEAAETFGGSDARVAESLNKGPSADMADVLAAALGITHSDAAAVLAFKVAAQGAVSRVQQWVTVVRRFELVQSLRMPAATLGMIAKSGSAGAAEGLRLALESTRGHEDWIGISTRVQDALRLRRRNALVSYLEIVGGENATELSRRLLIDVMGAEGRSRSRIGEACAAVQNLANAIARGLEPSCRPVGEKWSQWFWRKRYALWRGNREVFLFPENFLSNGNRSGASPLFEKFQNAVARGQITEDNAADAIRGYLSGLAEIGDLEYVAVGSTFEAADETRAPNEAQSLRRFACLARTRGAPGKYYFNELKGGGWSAFQEVPLGEDPGHVALACQGNGSGAVLVWPKPTLFPWPVLNLASDKESPTKTVLAVKYGWLQRHNDREWSAVRSTSGANLYRGANLSARQLVLGVSTAVRDGVLPSEILLSTHVHKTSAQNEVPRSYVSSMTLRTDTVAVQNAVNVGTWSLFSALPKDTDFEPWRGQGGADELRQLALQTVHVEKPSSANLVPWKSMFFDQGLQKSSSVQARLEVPHAKGLRAVLAGAPSLFSATLLPWQRNGNELRSSPWAFFASGVGWSFFFVQKDIGGTTNRGLGMKSSDFSSQWFSAAPGYHPFARALSELVEQEGIRSLYAPTVQRSPEVALAPYGGVARKYQALGLNAEEVYAPSSVSGVAATQETVDFSGLATFGLYNWELFFHAPTFLATRLKATGRHEEAQRFFHFVFNPLADSEQWWVTAPLSGNGDAQKSLEQILRDGVIGVDDPFKVLGDDPFDAHLVAKSRLASYQRYVVLEYAANLLDWGEGLLAKNTSEDVDEASQIVGLAAQIVGERPLQVPPAGGRTPVPFESPDRWRGGGNILVPLENLIEDLESNDGESYASRESEVPHLPLVRTAEGASGLYFSVPRNDRLSRYWDRVSDALQRVRSWRSSSPTGGLTVAADVQSLVDAAAAGPGAVQQALEPGMGTSLHWRFQVLVTKAKECAAEVRALGAGVLSALEKRDAESLASLRHRWEGLTLEKTEAVIQSRIEQAQSEVDAIKAAKGAALERQAHYESLSREDMNDLEKAAFGLNIAGAVLSAVSAGLDLCAAPAKAFPDITLGVSGFAGSPVSTVKIGGENIGGGMAQASRAIGAAAGLLDRGASMVATQAGYARRKEEWLHQLALAQHELSHLEAQRQSALLRKATAQRELDVHRKQNKAWEAQRDFLAAKYTAEELYTWLVGETNRIHREAFEQALGITKDTLAAYAFETKGTTAPSHEKDLTELVKKWQARRMGMTAGEELSLFLRNVEIDHLRNERATAQITRTISFRQLNPTGLRDLQNGNSSVWTVQLPGWWLEALDQEKAKTRRVRGLSVSLPCVVGTYANLNATLRLDTASNAPIKRIVLSGALQDSGWDLSRKDSRYAPFEGASLNGGTTWSFELGVISDVRPETITDVIIRIDYDVMESETPVEARKAEWPMELRFKTDAPDLLRKLSSSERKCSFKPTSFLPAPVRDLTRSKGTPTVGERFQVTPGVDEIALQLKPGAVLDPQEEIVVIWTAVA